MQLNFNNHLKDGLRTGWCVCNRHTVCRRYRNTRFVWLYIMVVCCMLCYICGFFVSFFIQPQATKVSTGILCWYWKKALVYYWRNKSKPQKLCSWLGGSSALVLTAGYQCPADEDNTANPLSFPSVCAMPTYCQDGQYGCSILHQLGLLFRLGLGLEKLDVTTWDPLAWQQDSLAETQSKLEFWPWPLSGRSC